MKIVIDLQCCQSGSRFGGIGRYALQLTKHIAKNKKDHEVHVIMNSVLLDGVPDVVNELILVIPESNMHIFYVPKVIGIAFPDNKSFEAEVYREQFISNLHPDIIFIMSVFEGMLEQVVVSVKKYYDIPTVAIMYDLIPHAEPDIFLPIQRDREAYYSRLEQMNRVDRMLSISDFSRDEAIRLLDLDPNRIVNISTAVRSREGFNLTKETRDKLEKEFSITKPFIMLTSSFCQRKNHRGLIEAFSKLPKDIKDKHQIVFVGNAWKDKCEELWNYASNLGLKKSDVIFTMKTDDEKMFGLYKMCSLFVYPSLFEGFGIPALEAMSFGVPTIGSNTTSLPEVIGMKEALFDPSDSDNMSQLILKGLVDEQFRMRLIDNAAERTKLFSWDKSAIAAIEAMESLLEEYKK